MDYQLLPANDAPQVLDDEAARNARNRSDRLSWLAIVISIICIAFNLLSTRFTSTSRPYTFPSATSFLTTQGMTREDIDSLKRPSQFIGFDKIYRNTTPTADVQSFVNFPMLMAHIDSSRPYATTKPRKGIRTSIGTVYPELSDMIVTSSISTIVQFRALDYGMERCELSIIIPSKGDAYPLVTPSASLQIYNIAHKKRLYGDSLSYINRPHRGGLIGEPHLERNSSWRHSFACLMDEIYTFEVACGNVQSGGCSLRWTQDKEHGHFPAILMTQFSTV